MMPATILRVVAVAIAIAGLADPVWTRTGSVRRPFAVVIIEPDQPVSPAARARLLASADRLRSALDPDYEVTVAIHGRESRASACPADGGCVVVSDGTTPVSVSAGADVIGGLQVAGAGETEVAIERIDRPDRINGLGSGRLNVWVRGASPQRPVVIRVFDQEMLVGEHATTVASAPIAINWVPLTTGARKLRVVAAEREGDQVVDRDRADVGVDVDAGASPLLMYEPEPTWLGTFVRRSLETDPRFEIDGQTRFGPGIVIGGRAARVLSRESLRDKRAVIVAAPEMLSREDVQLLERFVSVRGGSVVLLPDRRPAGPVTGLMPPIASERRESQVQVAGELKATEILTFDASSEATTVLARTGEHPVVVSRQIGRGHVIVSGALDAWRFRDSSFSRYWSALVADAALAAGPSLRLSLERSALQPGEETRVLVEWRAIDPAPERVTIGAQQTCGDGSRTSIRLWPAGRPGEFMGVVRAGVQPSCAVRATITEPVQLEARASLLVASAVSSVTTSQDAFGSAIQAHGGILATEERWQSLVDRAHTQIPPPLGRRESKLMRSPWWTLPFAGALGCEWWLRRRRGLR